MLTYLKIAMFFMALLGSVSTVEHSLKNYFKWGDKSRMPYVIDFHWSIFSIIMWTAFYALNQMYTPVVPTYLL